MRILREGRMNEQVEHHAQNHLDVLVFPKGEGKDYIMKRGKYTRMAYGRLNQSWQNAEDAVQEAYLKILENPPKKVMTTAGWEAFFTVVLKGVIYNSKRNSRQTEVNMTGKNHLQYSEVESDSDMDEYSKREEVVAVADAEKNPEKKVLAAEMLLAISEEIDRLRPVAKLVVSLNVLYGFKPRDIQVITGGSSNAIRQHIHRFRLAMEERV